MTRPESGSPQWVRTLLDEEDRAEIEALDAQVAQLEARCDAKFTDAEKKLIFQLNEAEGQRRYLLDCARWDAFLDRLGRHFPGLGPGLVAIAEHVAWGGDRNPGCCDLSDHGIGGL